MSSFLEFLVRFLELHSELKCLKSSYCNCFLKLVGVWGGNQAKIRFSLFKWFKESKNMQCIIYNPLTLLCKAPLRNTLLHSWQFFRWTRKWASSSRYSTAPLSPTWVSPSGSTPTRRPTWRSRLRSRGGNGRLRL